MATETCSKCGQTYENDDLKFVCPHCGHARWGEIIGMLVIGIVLLWVFFKVAPGISSNTWRMVTRGATLIFGGSAVIGGVVGVFQALAALGSGAGQTRSGGSPQQAIPRIAPPSGGQDAPGDRTKAQNASMEITSATIRNASNEELAQMISALDKRSDIEYSSDKAAYSNTCSLIREIGRKLDREGGEELMKQVLVRAGAYGCNTRFVEREWNGIGTWLG